KRLVEQPRLTEPRVDAAHRQSAQQSEKPARRREIRHVDAMLETRFGGLRGQLHRAVEVNRAHLVQRKLADDFAADADTELASALADLRAAFLHDEHLAV